MIPLVSAMTQILLIALVATAVALGAAVAYLFARARHGTPGEVGTGPPDRDEVIRRDRELAAIRARIEDIYEQQQTGSQTQHAIVAQQIDQMQQEIKARRRQVDGLQNQLRYEMEQQQEQIRELRAQLNEAVQVVRAAAAAPAPRMLAQQASLSGPIDDELPRGPDHQAGGDDQPDLPRAAEDRHELPSELSSEERPAMSPAWEEAERDTQEGPETPPSPVYESRGETAQSPGTHDDEASGSHDADDLLSLFESPPSYAGQPNLEDEAIDPFSVDEPAEADYRSEAPNMHPVEREPSPEHESVDPFLEQTDRRALLGLRTSSPSGGDGLAAEAPPATPEALVPPHAEDLTVLPMIDAQRQSILYEMGVFTIEDLARWTINDATAVAARLPGVNVDNLMSEWVFAAQSVLFDRYQERLRARHSGAPA